MKTNPPTHEAIARRAQEIWLAAGKPSGRDLEIWLSAEQQLSPPATAEHAASAPREKPEPTFHPPGDSPVSPDRIKSETAAESVVEYNISPAVAEADAVRAALQTPPSRATTPAPATTPPAATPSNPRKRSSRKKPPTPRSFP